MNSKNNIEKECKKATHALISMCNELCFNETSDNIHYIAIGKVNKYSDTHVLKKTQKIKFIQTFSDEREIMYQNYIKQNFIDLDFLADLIHKEQDKISVVDFNICYTSEKKTIIVVWLIYSSFKKEDILWHIGIIQPQNHLINSDKKFDANWQILQFSSPKKL